MFKQQKEEELAASRQSLRLSLDSTPKDFGIDQQVVHLRNASCLSLLDTM
jgi:hypothetical protein